MLSPEMVWNRGILEFPTAPRKILERGMILPRRDVSFAAICRLIVENQLLRFATALAPFVIAMLIRPDLALPVSQAPIAMLIVIGVFEHKVLRIAPDKRDLVTTEAAAARTLDTLNFRGRKILADIAAGRAMEGEQIYLVVEQSELARVPPLTLVSVQLDQGRSRLVPLNGQERDMIRASLFDDEMTERALQAANLREDQPMRVVSFDTRGVSAHARLAAFLDRSDTPAEAPA